MTKSLINPNQCRAYGVPVCDDPTDPHRSLGFQLDDIDIPFQMSGSTAVFKTQCPTPEEMDTCQKVFMSDPEYWDPINVEFNVSSVYENMRTTYNICDYDTAMSQISDGYHQPTLYKNLINSVTIKFPTAVPDPINIKKRKKDENSNNGKIPEVQNN